MGADLVIRGGTVVDGSGEPAQRADVAITDGRVSEIAPNIAGNGAKVLDAGDHIVAPGFIDIHTHYDAQVFWDPALSPSCFHGVTTVVAGNCGFSLAPTRPEHRNLIARTLENVEDMDVAALGEGIPWDFETFPEYLDSVRRRGTFLNYGCYVGHTALRLYVMGDDAYERAATTEEVEQMCAVVTDAMEHGSMGLATSFAITHRGADGKPIPSRHCETSEFVALAMAQGATGKGVVHIAPGQQLSIADMYPLQRQVGIPFTYGALLTAPSDTWRQNAALNAAEHREGSMVYPQVTPRPLTFQMTMAEPFFLNISPVFGDLMSKSRDERVAAYRDAAWRQKAWEDLHAGRMLAPRWDKYMVDETSKHSALIGRPMTEIAEERGIDPLTCLLTLALEEDLKTRFRYTVANDDADGVAFLMQQENCVLGLSDAGAHVGQLCDAPQATTLLGSYVRDRGVLTVEQAVRKLSGMQADVWGLTKTGRGYLRPGMWADVAVIDMASVAPGPIRRVRDFPADSERLTADAPTGVRHVLVNGVPIRVDGAMVTESLGARPGHVVSPA